MNLLSQRDKRWKDKLLGFNTATYTIGSHGCLITCQAMFLDTTPDEVNDKLKAVNGFVNGGFYVYGSLQKAYPYPQIVSEKITQTPLPLTTAQVKEIKTAFDGGKYVVLGIDSIPSTQAYDQHFVLLSGYSSSGYDIYDPWTGTERPMSDYFGANAKTFEQSVYQYLIYEVKGSVSCESKLAGKQAELDEVRESRDKWKNKYEELDKEYTEDIKAKTKHIEELQKTIAEQNVQLTLNSGSQEADKKELVDLRQKLADKDVECREVKDSLTKANKENERLSDLLIKCQDKEPSFLDKLINLLKGGAK